MINSVDYDAIVIGAGPAGSVCALQLARKKRNVLLVEKTHFPRYKVCGCCLNASSIRTLAWLDLLDPILRAKPSPVNNLRLYAGGRKAYIDTPPGLALGRDRLDSILLDECRAAGVVCMENTSALVARSCEKRRLVELHHKDGIGEARSSIVVVADGLGGTALRGLSEFATIPVQRSRVGVGTVSGGHTDWCGPGTIHMVTSNRGYVGAVQIEDGRMDIAAALDPSAIQRDGAPGETIRSILAAENLPINKFDELTWKGTPGLTRRRNLVAGDRLFVLGDSAGYTEPFTGQGISWALRGAIMVSDLADQACDYWSDQLALRWQNLHRKSIRREHQISLLFGTVLRNHAVMPLLIQTAGRFPSAAACLALKICGDSVFEPKFGSITGSAEIQQPSHGHLYRSLE